MDRSGYRYVVIDGQVFDAVERWHPASGSRVEFVDTKITARAYAQWVEGKQFPLTGYETDRRGIQRAAEIFAARFPKARINFINAPAVSDSSNPRVLTGWGYSGAMLLVNSTVTINPLQVLFRDYAGRVGNGEQTMDSFDQEIARVAPGLLADIL